MDLPFYLRILPSEALEVLAYYRRRNNNLAYADAMMTATGLSERGFGKAIRRLVTKGYLVLDGDQRYRLTEHGQRAVDDLPPSMADGADFVDDEAEADIDVERVPVDSSDNFDSLFDDDGGDDMDALFGDSDEPLEVEIDAEQFLIDTAAADDDAEDDDLFAEMNAEDEAAFVDLFGGMDGDTPETPAAEATTLDTVEADAVTDEAEPEDEDSDEFTPSWLDSLAAVPAALAQAAVEDTPTGEDAEPVEDEAVLADKPEDEPVSLFETLAEDDANAFSAPPPADTDASEDDALFDTLADDDRDSFVASPSLAELGDSSDDLFEWLEMDDDGSDNDALADLWDSEDDSALPEMPAPDHSEARIVGRRLVVALPQPLVAEQPAHITIGILPDEQAALAEPVPLMVRLSVVNGDPSNPAELPLMLTNGVTRQDVTITPGRFNQIRLRLRVFQLSDEADEAIACGGMYVDADVVEEPDGAPTPVAFGVDTHFYVDA